MKWKLPRITTTDRLTITPEVSEIMFDTDTENNNQNRLLKEMTSDIQTKLFKDLFLPSMFIDYDTYEKKKIILEAALIQNNDGLKTRQKIAGTFFHCFKCLFSLKFTSIFKTLIKFI